MNFADDRLLEYLDQEGAASPTQIVEDERISFGRTHANTRLSLLKSVELVRVIGNGVYEITPKGEQYLKGEIDCRKFPDPRKED